MTLAHDARLMFSSLWNILSPFISLPCALITMHWRKTAETVWSWRGFWKCFRKGTTLRQFHFGRAIQRPDSMNTSQHPPHRRRSHIYEKAPKGTWWKQSVKTFHLRECSTTCTCTQTWKARYTLYIMGRNRLITCAREVIMCARNNYHVFTWKVLPVHVKGIMWAPAVITCARERYNARTWNYYANVKFSNFFHLVPSGAPYIYDEDSWMSYSLGHWFIPRK